MVLVAFLRDEKVKYRKTFGKNAERDFLEKVTYHMMSKNLNVKI